jgi:hypothetical protein
LLLVRRVRLLLLLLLPPLRACPPHAPLPGAPGQGSKGGYRSSPRGLACAAPIHVACALRLFQRPLWGQAGWAPADGAPALRSCLCPAPGRRGLARAMHAAYWGKGAVAGRGGATGGAQIKACQFVMHGEMSTTGRSAHRPVRHTMRQVVDGRRSWHAAVSTVSTQPLQPKKVLEPAAASHVSGGVNTKPLQPVQAPVAPTSRKKHCTACHGVPPEA